MDNAWDAIAVLLENRAELTYAPGYNAEKIAAEAHLISEAVEIAKQADVVILFAGLPDISESEGFDRTTLDMPEGHIDLIYAVTAVQPRTVVVLSNGSPVTMPWLNSVEAVLETYLGGQAWGQAVADLLFGIANPCGKLPESFPRKLEDVPASPNFPGGTQSVAYAESIYVGYRYYDTAKTDLLFPFGFGLSYTSFEYSDMHLSDPDPSGTVTVHLSLTNTGRVPGKEIVQIYVRDVETSVFRPEKELKGFSKVPLQPGETKQVTIKLDKRAFSFWDTGRQEWVCEAGDFEIIAASSAADIHLRETVYIPSEDRLSDWAAGLKRLVPGYFKPSIARFADIGPDSDFARLMESPLPSPDIPENSQITRLSTVYEARKTFIGKLIYKAGVKVVTKMAGKNPEPKTLEMMMSMLKEMPLKSMAMMNKGITSPMVDGLVAMMNGRFFKGLGQVLRGRRK